MEKIILTATIIVSEVKYIYGKKTKSRKKAQAGEESQKKGQEESQQEEKKVVLKEDALRALFYSSS